MNDESYMEIALSLAGKGFGHVNPNPMVGAVIVKDGTVIGQGWHEKYGGLHAERNALAHCAASPEGAVMYVTLEPCCHWGKTPPCTDAIIESGIRRVVIGSSDPNPLVAGKGVKILKEHGIQVTEGVLKEKCDRLNQVFFHYISRKTPYVTMKYAMTMDGKIATCTGKSRWITGEEARRRVHWDRHGNMGIMIGMGTLLADDPMLNCRLKGGRNPVRIICDSRLRAPKDSQIIRTAGEIPTILATCCSDPERIRSYEDLGCQVVTVPEREGMTDLPELMKLLGARNIDSILLEGGAGLNASALKSGIVNRVQAYIAPKLFGGAAARSPVGDPGVESPGEAYRLTRPRITYLGEDILLESEVISCLPES